MKVTAWIDNESRVHERFDLHLQVMGKGKVAEMIEECALTGEPVMLEGNMTCSRMYGELRTMLYVSTLRRVEVAV